LKEKLCDDIPDDFGYPVIPKEGVESNFLLSLRYRLRHLQ
jgi:hypothetical protein